MPIPIVNEQDEIIWHKERSEVWKELMRGVVLLVVNEEGKYLLAQRASTKKRDPNKWTVAVSGMVEQGESYEEAIIRETKEELGITVTPSFLMKRKCVGEEAINFFQAIFYVQLSKDTQLTFDEQEVQDTKRLSKAEINQRLKDSPDDIIGAFHKYREIVKNMALPLIKHNQKGKTYQADNFQILYRNAGSILWENDTSKSEEIYFITGTAEIAIQKQTFIVESPAKVIIPENTYHKIEAKSDISFILFIG